MVLAIYGKATLVLSAISKLPSNTIATTQITLATA